MEPFLLCLIILVVLRARRAGATWFCILASLSQFFNFLIGGNINETFSTRVGRHVRDGDEPAYVWKTCGRALDLIFFPLEPDHCARAYRRTYKTERGLC